MQQDHQKRRVLIIGIDGGTFDIINPLFKQGKLPNLYKLSKRGFSAPLSSIIYPISPAAWGSFTTGVNPGKHGLYDFSTRKNGSYDQRPTNSRDLHLPSIWHLLAQRNLKVGLVNVPGTYPPEPVNGFMVSGFPTPEENNDFTYPRSLLKELKDIIPNYHLQQGEIIRVGNEKAALKDTNEITKNITKTTLHIAMKLSWDLLITVYAGADALGHHFWKYMDPNHPDFEKSKFKIYGNVINDIYVLIDHEIGKLMSLVDDNTYVIIMSDHGFGGAYKALGLNDWLLKNDWIQARRGVISRLKYFGYRHGFNLTSAFRLAKVVRTLKHRKKIYAEQSVIRNLVMKLFFSTNNIDWSRTKAYCVGNCGQIYLNVKGREPKGIIPPESRLTVAEKLRSELLQLKDDETGEVIFDNVFLREELYHGPFVEEAADLICYNSSSRFLIIRYLEFGGGELAFPHPIWSGAHRLNGILFLNGPCVQGSEKRSNKVNILDVTPTVMTLLGAPIADYMDGKPITEAFQPEFLNAQLATYALEKVHLNIAINHLMRDIEI